MSGVRFDGKGAGLGKRLGGDTNSLHDYTIICACKSELGPVSGFRANQLGERTVLCLNCKHATVLDKDLKVKAYVLAPKEIVEKAAAQSIMILNGKTG